LTYLVYIGLKVNIRGTWKAKVQVTVRLKGPIEIVPLFRYYKLTLSL